MIPKSFDLLGHNIKVKVIKKLLDKGVNVGESNDPENTITISNKYKDGDKVKVANDDYIEHTFYHELIHQILTKMGEYKLNNNEKFVDNFAALLHQFEKSKKFK